MVVRIHGEVSGNLQKLNAGIQMTPPELVASQSRIAEWSSKILRLLTCRGPATDAVPPARSDHGASTSTARPPRAPQPAGPVYSTAPSYTPAEASRVHTSRFEDDDDQDADAGAAAAASPSQEYFDRFFDYARAQDELGASQIRDAPPAPTQEDYDTPGPSRRPARTVVPPEPLSYPTDHVHAQQRRQRNRTFRGVQPKRRRD